MAEEPESVTPKKEAEGGSKGPTEDRSPSQREQDPKVAKSEKESEAEVDDTVEDTFPASDPPAW